MTEEKQNTVWSETDRVNAVIDGLTLFDDDLMSRVFDKNIEVTELVLRIIFGRNMKVISVIGQDELKNHKVGGRNITLDIHAIDVNGEEVDIEVQGNAEGAHVRRARYHSSMVDSRMLDEGQSFKNLKDSYVIFIYKHDKFKRGLPIYHVDRYVGETAALFEDGSHIIYVNGNYKGDDEIGQLMRDFHQADSKNIHYDVLAHGVKHYKEDKGGRENMCEAVEKYAREYAKEHAKDYAKDYVVRERVCNVRNLMDSLKFTLDQALDALKIQGSERELVASQVKK